MEVIIQCDHCQATLSVPPEAAGQMARCPSCQAVVFVPLPESLLDDSLAAPLTEPGTLEESIAMWIEHDVLEVIEDKDRRTDQPTAARAAPPTTEPRPADPNAPATPDAKPATGRLWEVRADQPRPKLDFDIPAPTETPKKKPRTKDAVPTRGYPTNLHVKDPVPHLVVYRVNTAGVRFAFDSHWLTDERFRASIPIRCVFTGERDRSKLMAVPMLFNDRLLRKPDNLDALVSAHIIRNIGDKTPLQVTRTMGKIEAVAEPFCHAMPYYVCTSYAHYNLHVQTRERPSGALTCDILIPDPAVALKWLGHVNGVCGAEYGMLEHDVSLLHGSAWRKLDDACRQRLNTWCKLDPDETFRAYFNDADFAAKDAGLAGLVITDQRIIFNKHHRHGHVVLSRPNTTIVAHAEGKMAALTLEHDGQRHKMITLRAADLNDLAQLLTGEALALVVN